MKKPSRIELCKLLDIKRQDIKTLEAQVPVNLTYTGRAEVYKELSKALIEAEIISKAIHNEV